MISLWIHVVRTCDQSRYSEMQFARNCIPALRFIIYRIIAKFEKVSRRRKKFTPLLPLLRFNLYTLKLLSAKHGINNENRFVCSKMAFSYTNTVRGLIEIRILALLSVTRQAYLSFGPSTSLFCRSIQISGTKMRARK